MLCAQIAVTRLSFAVHEEVLVSALIKSVMVLPTVMTLQMKQSAVSYDASFCYLFMYWCQTFLNV